MRILVVSDTHGDLRNLDDLLEQDERFDMLIHCGDICGDEDRVRQRITFAFLGVAGNMDFSGRFPADRVIEAGNKKIFVAHGHRHGVRFDTDTLGEEAIAEGADIALYGHTHIPEIHEQDGIIVMNPGSLSYPRQEGRQPSYGVIEIGEDGSVHCEIKYL